MRVPGFWKHRRRLWIPGSMAVACALAVLGPSVASAGGTPPPVSAARWRQAIRHLSVPEHGCFTAASPAVAWRKTRCVSAPHHPYPPRHGSGHPRIAGNGVDYSAEVSGGNLSSVVGSFDSITAGATETRGPSHIINKKVSLK